MYLLRVVFTIDDIGGKSWERLPRSSLRRTGDLSLARKNCVKVPPPFSLSELTVTGRTCKLYQDTGVIVRNLELSNDFWTFKLNFRKVIYKTIVAFQLRDKARKYDRLLK